MDFAAIQSLTRSLLVAIGEDPDREGLKDTPRRVADYWREFVDYNPGTVDTTFEAVSSDQLVVVKGMRVWSLCEHHLLPFWCDISVGYIADGKVLGLSKFARIAHQHAHKLQLQERLVDGIAADVVALTGSPDVAVLASGQHLCMVSRGIRTDGRMISSVMRGVFRTEYEARMEFLALAGQRVLE